MNCPKCGARALIYNSRPKPENRVWRRRRCRKCGYCFSTVEMTLMDLAKQINNR